MLKRISGNLSRRALMSGVRMFAFAAALPPVIAAAAKMSPIKPVVSEDAKLLALGEQIDSLLKRYRMAAERKREARATAEALCPPVPDELLQKPKDFDYWAGCCIEEIDVQGDLVWPDGGSRPPRKVLNSERMKVAIADGNLNGDRRTKQAKAIRRLIELAETYEAERTAAIERSGLTEAVYELRRSAQAIDELAYAVRELAPPTTVVGVTIQARALMALAEAELDFAGHGRAGAVLGRELASSVLLVGVVDGASGNSRAVPYAPVRSEVGA